MSRRPDGLVGEAAATVICRSVLEGIAAARWLPSPVLRRATVSVLAANVVAAVLHRALAGRYAEARHLLAAEETAEAAGPGPGVPRRFTLAGLTALIEGAGLRPGGAHGIRVFSGILPGARDDPVTADDLRALKAAAAVDPAVRAARLHILGYR